MTQEPRELGGVENAEQAMEQSWVCSLLMGFVYRHGFSAGFYQKVHLTREYVPGSLPCACFSPFHRGVCLEKQWHLAQKDQGLLRVKLPSWSWRGLPCGPCR